MNHQQFFEACHNALLNSTPLPTPRPASYTDNHIYMSFQDIRKNMDPRVWPAEVAGIAADFDLCQSEFRKAWERFNRKDCTKAVGHA